MSTLRDRHFAHMQSVGRDLTALKEVLNHKPWWDHKDLPMPSSLQSAANYMKARSEYIQSGRINIPIKGQQHRRAICDPCEYRNRKQDACTKCGCPLHPTFLGDFLTWASSKCKAGKWKEWIPGMPHHWELTRDSDVEWCMRLLEQPPGPWPKQFQGYPNISDAFTRLLKKYAAAPAPMPTFPIERGIVISGGGWRFFPSIYVNVRTIRHLGCKLPIQVWYMGDRNEFDRRMFEALQPFDVGWVCANSFMRENMHTFVRRQIDHGWLLKPYAAAYSPFKEVISLDADSFPVYNPEQFMAHGEYRRVGAAFWPDRAPLEAGQWERFGIHPAPDFPGLESGQFIVDKSRHWAPLWLTYWMNTYWEYLWNVPELGVHGHLYGDKDTFALAWFSCGHEACVPRRYHNWASCCFMQLDFDGNPVFCHYTQDKPKLGGEIDGIPIPSHYHTKQETAGGWGRYAHPHNEVQHEFLRECDELLRPSKNFHFAGGQDGWCRDIWQSINLGNEYRIPSQIEGLVYDIGANVGAFAHLCLRRGASKVVCIEPYKPNVDLINKNLARWKQDRWVAYCCGVGGTMKKGLLIPHSGHTVDNTSVLTTVHKEATGIECDIIPLDELIGEQQVRLLKIDCEGSEYEAFYNSKRIRQIQEVCGETHTAGPDSQTLGWPEDWTIDGIIAFFQKNGYTIEAFKNGPCTHLFWAKRID